MCLKPENVSLILMAKVNTTASVNNFLENSRPLWCDIVRIILFYLPSDTGPHPGQLESSATLFWVPQILSSPFAVFFNFPACSTHNIWSGCLPSVFYTVQFCIYSKKKTKFIGLIAVRSDSCSVLTFYHGMKIQSSQLKIWQW